MAAAGAACRPVLASARLPKFSWTGGEPFSAGLWLLNDTPDELPPGEMVATLEIGGDIIPLAAWEHGPVSPNHNLAGPAVGAALPERAATDRFTLQLRCPAAGRRDSRYLLHYRPLVPPAG